MITKLIKKDIKLAELFVSKGIISILTPIVMEVEFDSTDKNRINLIRNTVRILSELTDMRNPEILVIIMKYYEMLIEIYCKGDWNSSKFCTNA